MPTRRAKSLAAAWLSMPDPLEYLRLGNHVAEDMYRGKSVDPDDVRLFKAATQLQEARADIMELTSTVKVLLNTIQSMGK